MHVMGQSRVTRVIERLLGILDQEATWIASVAAIRELARMNGVDELDPSELKCFTAPVD
jgi:hypothetical protein